MNVLGDFHISFPNWDPSDRFGGVGSCWELECRQSCGQKLLNLLSTVSISPFLTGYNTLMCHQAGELLSGTGKDTLQAVFTNDNILAVDVPVTATQGTFEGALTLHPNTNLSFCCPIYEKVTPSTSRDSFCWESWFEASYYVWSSSSSTSLQNASPDPE